MRPDAFKRAAAAARSGLRRYPRHVWQSLRDAASPPLPTPEALAQIRSAVGDLAPLMVGDAISAVWLGHATVLLRLGGLNILTDPVFSHRIGVSIGRHTVGVSRMTPPPLDVSHLPPIDLLLISHAHFDHLDRPSLRRLVDPRTTVITARQTAGLIPKGFRDVVELDWDAAIPFGPLTVTAWKPAHWGARRAVDRARGYNSYVISCDPRSPTPNYSVLFAGDTAHTEALSGTRPIDLAIFGIGAYDPWDHAHATPEQVWDMFRRVARDETARLLPIHHSTFELSDEHPDEPMRRLLAAAGDAAHAITCHTPGAVWGAA
ncbi:MAG: MBL fold metallo-hydrolase [Phycisphaerales bacterium]